MKNLMIVLIVVFVSFNNAYSLKSPPAELAPLILSDYQVKCLRFQRIGKEKIPVGVIGIYSKAGDLLWRVKVYGVIYNSKKESDVQYAHISKLEKTEEGVNTFKVYTELKGVVFEVNLAERKIKEIKNDYKGKVELVNKWLKPVKKRKSTNKQK